MVTGGAREQLADVTAAAVAVAVESARTGKYNVETARTLAAVVGEMGARIVGDAELRGFSTGWQEAMATRAPAPARALRAAGAGPRGATAPGPRRAAPGPGPVHL
ncbi:MULTISPECIES: hypothetical protein [Streptomyces]|uniref:hypothetical protein n=1 Tax=Streptomyces TaxID=1883 RepID=UPI00081E4B7D|nr:MULTISPECIES: hypothetical protein [unclassified Streptomyces]MDT0424801.1 hypothetical protein [Streptomyces sp. DSM 41859]MYR25117.1 hypothetical protein [Streptomyces sp. SID4945]WEH28478.1 hypothetical protein P0D76_14660 [Streptomyces sp. AM 3-1-1]SCE74423.1 hypothetical protein GA0115257_10175 [Streptomyces sp. LcepLS]